MQVLSLAPCPAYNKCSGSVKGELLLKCIHFLKLLQCQCPTKGGKACFLFSQLFFQRFTEHNSSVPNFHFCFSSFPVGHLDISFQIIKISHTHPSFSCYIESLFMLVPHLSLNQNLQYNFKCNKMTRKDSRAMCPQNVPAKRFVLSL